MTVIMASFFLRIHIVDAAPLWLACGEGGVIFAWEKSQGPFLHFAYVILF